MNPVRRLSTVVSRLCVPRPVSAAISATGRGRAQEVPRALDPACLDEGARSAAGGRLERAREVVGAQRGAGRKIVKMDRRARLAFTNSCTRRAGDDGSASQALSLIVRAS